MSAVCGPYIGLTDRITRALVVDLVSEERRATALGLFSMTMDLATFPASAAAGLLWQWRGPAAAFAYGAALAALAAALVSG